MHTYAIPSDLDPVDDPWHDPDPGFDPVPGHKANGHRDRSMAALCGGLLAGWLLHRITAPQPPTILLNVPEPEPRPSNAILESTAAALPRIGARPSFDEKLCELQDELIRIDIGPDRWDFYIWDKGRELEPVHLRNAGQTQNHRILSLYRRKADGTLDEEGMLVPIARLTKLDL